MKTFLKHFVFIYATFAVGILALLSVSGKNIRTLANQTTEKEAQFLWNLFSIPVREEADLPDIKRSLQHLADELGARVTLADSRGFVLLEVSSRFLPTRKLEGERSTPPGGNRKRPEFVPFRLQQEGSIILEGKLHNGWTMKLELERSPVSKVSVEFGKITFLLLLYGFAACLLITWFFLRKIRVAARAIEGISENLALEKTHIHLPRFRDPLMEEVTSPSRKIYGLMKKKLDRLHVELHNLETVTRHLNEAIILLDRDERVHFFNDKAEEILETRLNRGEKLISLVSDPEILLFCRKLTGGEREDRTIENLKGKTYEVYVKKAAHHRLAVIREVTGGHIYEEFKAELIGNITHELKTPLALLMGYAETLINTPDMDEKTREEFLEAIHKSSTRLNNLINDMLELHRLESTDKDFRVNKPTNLEELKVAILETFSGNGKKEIFFEAPRGEVYILFDHLLSVLVNLVDNAVKYSEGEKVDVRIRKENDKVIVEVSDEGPRIPEDKRELIFKRFYTLSRSRTRRKSGTGLGLSIVKHICALYDGTVTLLYNDSGGNTFRAEFTEKKPIL